jgi:hypothetical protein
MTDSAKQCERRLPIPLHVGGLPLPGRIRIVTIASLFFPSVVAGLQNLQPFYFPISIL